MLKHILFYINLIISGENMRHFILFNHRSSLNKINHHNNGKIISLFFLSKS